MTHGVDTDAGSGASRWTEERLAAARHRLDSLAGAEDDDSEFERAAALVEIGRTLTALGRFREAADPLAEAEEIFASRDDTTQALAKVRLLRANGAAVLERHEQALGLLETFEAAGVDPGIPNAAAYASNIRLESLLGLERYAEALDAAQAVLDDPHPDDQSQMQRSAHALAHYAQAAAAWRLGRPDVAVPAAERAVAEYLAIRHEDDDPEPRSLARAMLTRAAVLEEHGDRRTARAAMRDFIREFAGASEPTLRKAVRRTRARRLGLLLHVPAMPAPSESTDRRP